MLSASESRYTSNRLRFGVRGPMRRRTLRSVDQFLGGAYAYDGAMDLPEELIDRAMSAYAMARLAGEHVDDAGHAPGRATFNAMASAAKMVPELVQAIRERSLVEPGDYFDTHPIGALVQFDYDGNDEPIMREGVDVYECKSCSALVRDTMQRNHATGHELVTALLHQITESLLRR
jgi:hypothetical protein